jgi:hypothetical protein
MGIGPSSSLVWISVSFLLLGYFASTFVTDVHATADCDPQSIPTVNCPPTPSEEADSENEDNSGNIEDEIPSVLPFP